MPSLTISCAGSFLMSVPANVTLPARGAMMPLIVRSVVVLPAPFDPIRVTISPSRTSIEMPLSASMRPYDVRRFSIRSRGSPAARGARSVIASRLARGGSAGAEVGLDHGRVALDLDRDALGDLLAVIEHRDALGDLHD